MKSTHKILIIPGSLRANSSTNAVVRAVVSLNSTNLECTVYNGLCNLPHFNDSDASPEPVQEFRNLIKATDGVLFCTPEYAFGIPGSLKNALDWSVSSGEFSGKPTAVITAATGGDKAHAALLLVLSALDAKVVKETTLLLSFIRSKLNDKNEVKDAATLPAIQSVITALVNIIGDMQAAEN